MPAVGMAVRRQHASPQTAQLRQRRRRRSLVRLERRRPTESALRCAPAARIASGRQQAGAETRRPERPRGGVVLRPERRSRACCGMHGRHGQRGETPGNRGAASRRNPQAADSTAAHSAAGAAARECGAPSPEQQILAGCGMAPTPSIRTQALKWDTHDAVTDAAASHLRNRGRGPRRSKGQRT